MSERGMTVGEVLAVLANESDADAGAQLEAWQVAVSIGLTDLLPRALAQRATALLEAGLLDPPPVDRPALRLDPLTAASLEQLRQRFRYVPGRRR
jgi:hypothetical protein